MKKLLKKAALCVLSAALMLSALVYAAPNASALSYTPSCTTVKIGMYYGSSALESANLQNATGFGSGYRFGYYDLTRSFVDIGAYTYETQITMLRDRNMYYDSSTNQYYSGTDSAIVIGCFHIQLETPYGSYDEARAAADTFTSVNAFVKYSSGSFYVCAGEFTSEADAYAQASAIGIQQGYTITSGTAYTVSIVATGTDTILFEFEYGGDYWLGVQPSSDDGSKTQTWFKGYKYYGGFQYARLAGENMTVVNILNIEDYVKGVVPYEASPSWPIESLKAQALSARTYVAANFNKHSSGGFDVCNTTDCQVYHGTNSANANSDASVDSTAGQYLLYNGKLATTFYMSCDGGATENSENVWQQAVGYLVGVADPYESVIADSISGYYWSRTYTNAELTSYLQNRNYSIGTIVNFEASQYTPTGNVYKITFTDVNGKTLSFSKEKARTVLGLSSMRYTVSGGRSAGTVYVNDSSSTISGNMSAYYAISGGGLSSILPSGTLYAISGRGSVSEINTGTTSASTGTYTITGTGKGHNVGMSQWGAYAMAKYYDCTYDQILKFYFTGIEIAYSR